MEFAKPLFDYMVERENIRKKKEAGIPAPWTDDPILQKYQFTNVRRDFDRTTRELKARWYEPNVANATPGEILFNCGVARFVNEADSVCYLGWQTDYDPDHTMEMIRLRLAEGTFFRGAYKVPNLGKAVPKEEAVAQWIFGSLWTNRDRIMRNTLKENGWQFLVGQLKEHVWGVDDFYGKEIALDYMMATGWRPRDLLTFPGLGPGSRRGLNWLRGREVDWQVDSKSHRVRYMFLHEIMDLYRARHDFLPEDFTPLIPHDIQFCLCEYNKYRTAENSRGKRLYAA